jgi:hypothetical protein
VGTKFQTFQIDLISKRMKRIFKIWIFTAFLAISPVLLFAQTPPHPNGGAGPGSGNTKVGDNPAGAAIGDGVFILLALSMAYAGRKIYEIRSVKEEKAN